MLARLVVGARNTLGIALAAVSVSIFLGGILGLIAGYSRGWLSNMIMRLADIIMSFPSLLLALIVLFTLGPSITNLIIVLAITRIPIYLRTTRAEVLEVRERMFVSAALAMGARPSRIVFRHIAPLVLPTLFTIAAIDFATVVLAESSLSFLGLGIQPPQFTWGAMVATGRGYLANAWWIAFWPGLAILLTTLSLNILSSWARTYADPQQRWRVELPRKAMAR
jgi:peptide/nickel transport system permease protein